MQIKVKSLVLVISLIINTFFILFFIISIISKNSLLSIYTPDDNYVTACAVVSAPVSSAIVFDLIEITLKPEEKAFLQFSVISEKKQVNFLITALYDNDIISVTQNGYGIGITALREGVTVMQTLSNDGIKDVALITVSK